MLNVEVGPKKPTNPETDAYKKYLENQRNRGPGAARSGRTPEEKKWDKWKKDRHTEEFQSYVDYKDSTSGPREETEKDLTMDQYEKDTFGDLESGGGTGEHGKYTVDDLYIKASDKRWQDQRRSDLLIDPDKKDKKGGGGKKGGGRKSGGKTSGPGNPNTGGGGGGAGGPNL